MEIEGDKYFVLLYLLLLLVVLATPAVLADGLNDNLTTYVIVGNAAPTVGEITCDPPSTITLTAETSTLLNCTATVSDNNGYENLMGIRGEFYNDSLGASDNYTKHYNNATCLFTSNGTTDTNSTVECTFSIYFHANPAEWTIYFNVSDAAGDTGSNTGTITVASLTALNVTETVINFGNLDLDETSAQQNTTIKNTGNVELDIRINESSHGGNMSCDGVGSADINTSATSTGVRYNTTNAFIFDEADWELTSNNNLIEVNWSKSYDGGSTTPPGYDLYWLIKVPSSGVSGNCSTVTRITATAS
ncbi:MAG: hypothetical protein U9Q92_01545 [archaeon]|nr:hypothetical protein [archaeon]